MRNLFEQYQIQFEEFACYALQKTQVESTQPQSFFNDLHNYLQTSQECQEKFSKLLLSKMELSWKLSWMMYFLSGKSINYSEIAKKLNVETVAVKKYRTSATMMWSNSGKNIVQKKFICPREQELRYYLENSVHPDKWPSEFKQHVKECSMCYSDWRLFSVLATQKSKITDLLNQFVTQRQSDKLRVAVPFYINQYKVVDKIGQGGMGAVYKVEDTKLNRIAAVKTIVRQNNVAIQRFIQEAKAMAQFNHPNIVQIYEVIEAQGNTCYLVMEYVEGVSLKHSVNNLSISDTIKLFHNLAMALQIIHDKGIIHRDLKPSNIMINKEGQLKIMDFGIAKWQDGSVDLTNPGAMVGTIPYMSPEQLNNDSVGIETDIWALGVMLYYLLTGKQPFRKSEHDNDVNIMNNIMNYKPKLPSQYNQDIPKKLEDICMKMLEKDRRNRYVSLKELVSALQQIKSKSSNHQRHKRVKNQNKTKLNALFIYAGIGLITLLFTVVMFFTSPSVYTQPKVLQNDKIVRQSSIFSSYENITIKVSEGLFTYIFQCSEKQNIVQAFSPEETNIKVSLSRIKENQDWYIANTRKKLNPGDLQDLKSQVFERGVSKPDFTSNKQQSSFIQCNMFYKTKNKGFQPLKNILISISNVSIRVEIRPKRKTQFVSLAKRNNKVREGDVMRFIMTAKEESYIAIFLKDGKRNVEQLYPIEDYEQQLIHLEKFIFPDKNIHNGVEGFPFNDVKGMEQLFYFYANTPFAKDSLKYLTRWVQKFESESELKSSIERGVDMPLFKKNSFLNYQTIKFEHH